MLPKFQIMNINTYDKKCSQGLILHDMNYSYFRLMLSCNVINTLLIKLLQTLFLHSQRDGHNLETDHGDAEAANW